MATSTAETMTGCGERYNQHCQYDSKSFDHRLEAGTVAAALGSTQTGTGVTNGAARFITITILKIMLKIVIKTTMPGCECFRMQRDLPRSPSFLRARNIGRQKLHPWQVKWTQQVPVATLKLAFNWFLFFSWTRPGETNSLGRSRWMLHHPILNILKIIYTYMCNSAVFKTQNFSFQSWRMGTVLDLPQLWANGPLPMGLW